MAENCAQNNLPCCACAACTAICPQGALSIELNAEGFYIAVCDTQKCNGCGLCLKVCQKFEQNYSPAHKQFAKLPLYAAWSNDEAGRIKSSSGGIAYEIALYGLHNGYKIAGAVYDAASGKANTVIADTKEKLEALRGSKYMQSLTDAAFKEIAQSKDKFIFFGTPCQVAGLKLLAHEGNFEDRILTADFFCHGVPSFLILDKYLNTLPQFAAGDSTVDFRHKKKGCGPYTMLVKNAKEELAIEEHINPFYALYFSDLFLCDACYKCRAKKSFDFADIRLGDFWGEDFKDEGKGVSALCAVTEKGAKIIAELTDTNKITAMARAHGICLKEQACFKDTPCDSALRQHLFALLKQGYLPKQLTGEYLKALSLKKNIIFRVKQVLPFPLKNAVKKLYRGFKQYGK